LIIVEANKDIEIQSKKYLNIIWYKNGQKLKLLEKLEKSSLAQSLDYVIAKSMTEKWNFRVGIIKNNQKIIAVVFVLEKKWGPLKIKRINRGPIFLEDSISNRDKQFTFKFLKKQWRWSNGEFSFFSPFLDSNEDNISMLKSVRFIRWSRKQYHSIWIDLKQSEELLRANLKASWRRNLVKSEKKEMLLNISNNKNDFEFLLNKHEEMMKEKNFIGSSLELIRNYYKNNKKNLFIFQAIYKNRIIASTLIVKHGLSCTYWIGWNGREGRELRANHFLFWKIILNMKKMNFLWFDLGGVNKKNTPGISRFKKGFGGEDYNLIGEWI